MYIVDFVFWLLVALETLGFENSMSLNRYVQVKRLKLE